MPSRRTFLKAAAAAPFVFSRSAAAVAANDKIVLGFIGIGIMSRGHLENFLGRAEVEVIAVCDVVKERREDAVRRVEKRYADRIKSGDYKGVKAFVDFRELLALPGLDAVVVGTPDHWHAIPSILAARAGKHVYCEKPLTQNLADGRAVVEAVAKHKVVFQTGSQQRSEFGGHFRKAVEYVWNGRIGKVHTVRINVGGPAKPCDLPGSDVPPGTDWDRWLGPAPERPFSEVLCPKGIHNHFPAWRAYQEYAGGGLADMGAHHFDIAQWALKTGRSGPVAIEPPADPGSGRGLRFRYADGTLMIHNEFPFVSAGRDVRADCVFEGSAGTILVSRNGIASYPDAILREPIGANEEHVYPSLDHKKNWLDCIRSGKETICPAEIGHRSASICHLGNIGYRLGRPLKWNPAKEEFENDAAANKELRREPRGEWKV